jgi:hypothetical protein
MFFKLAAYAECPTCHGSGVVKGSLRTAVPCKSTGCVDGFVTVLVTRQEMVNLLSDESVLTGEQGHFVVAPHPLHDPAPGKLTRGIADRPGHTHRSWCSERPGETITDSDEGACGDVEEA